MPFLFQGSCLEFDVSLMHLKHFFVECEPNSERLVSKLVQDPELNIYYKATNKN